MSSKKQRSLADEYRTRFRYCSIGATLMCLGVIIMVSGLVVYIISATGPHSYINNMWIHHQHRFNGRYWPLIIAIILASSGIAFITIAIVFTLLACFSHGRIEEQFNHIQSMSAYPSQTADTQYERQKLIEIPVSNQKVYDEMVPTSSPPPRPPPEPINIQASNPYRPVVVRPKTSTTPKSFQMDDFDHKVVNHHQISNEIGDINTVGLPSNHDLIAAQKKVPTNGFSYLARPEQIQQYYQTHQRSSNPMLGNHNHRNQSSSQPSPLPIRSATAKLESII
ncbi:hypothetical protein SSS_02612 [Sarcoptes scabiei]|uniref:Uncharacterized protein n=1 Tax=Sarcoptes scabiei TaxID=52283 RepID=A0A132AI61_SARSC|nr:hypothetical protein SSS_02612 [Sarcoptes scabiei]KPM10686.1 hypothetical protein QR98_0092460 [Sarcoptes scabiei]UXI20748.1 hypothetical protein NH340_JMT06691 [Sarcoptes scabiei]